MFPINQVLQGDCTRVLRQLPDAAVDLIVTDPPYGVRYQDRLGRAVVDVRPRRCRVSHTQSSIARTPQ